jgi:hypothetical protein
MKLAITTTTTTTTTTMESTTVKSFGKIFFLRDY